MEGLWIIVVLAVVFAPITLSIVAVVKVSNLRHEVDVLRKQLMGRREEQRTAPVQQPVSAPIKEVSTPAVPIRPQTTVVPKPPERPSAASRSPKPKIGLEFMMGGRAAAFAGIAILVIGIVFLVGYAIQHAWIGPGMRVILGLLAGGLLVGIGHFAGQRNEKYILLARVLTGGGSALFYFTVFSAYAFYHLIGPVAAGVGLVACALAVFGLSMVYSSQAVAVLGVLGAFTTPLLIGGEMDAGIFPLVYVAIINVPVILLGVHRKWQVLYNLAFIFTGIHFLIWLNWVGDRELWSGLGFAVLYFLEFATLGLLKLRSEQNITGRNADTIRLVSASILLLGAVYVLLDDAGHQQWIGSAFLILALLHVALAQFAFKTLARFSGEILSFLAGALFFATLALPAQLDGAWVSLGWALEGVVLAWFAARVQSRILQGAAFLLGLIGMMKGLLFDVSLYSDPPRLFLNARFLVGAASAGLLGLQGRFAARYPDEGTSTHWQDALWWISVLGAVGMFFADTFWTVGASDAFSWLLTSIMLLGTGTVVVLFAPRASSVTKLGSILLLLVPLKLLVIDAWVGLDIGGYGMKPFGNAVIYVQLVMVGLLILMIQPRISASSAEFILPKATFTCWLNLMALAAGIGVLTIEMLRGNHDWQEMAVSIMWAVSALALILFGMKKKNASHRYFGLVLFGLTTLKVLLVDSSELNGLERIGAFMGTGVLLLVLSFAYQKASAYFQAQGDPS